MRGINVGTAKRVPMAELRALAEELGHTNVSTILNSGNLLFDCKATSPDKLALMLRAAIQKKCAVDCAVTVLPGATLKAILAHNPLAHVALDPARYLVAFPANDEALAQARTLSTSVLPPDEIAFDEHAAYLWCDGGILDAPLMKSFTKLMKERVTTRNWTTLVKVCAGL
jgi:uncharacterized protein (DUF1697 family)